MNEMKSAELDVSRSSKALLDEAYALAKEEDWPGWMEEV